MDWLLQNWAWILAILVVIVAFAWYGWIRRNERVSMKVTDPVCGMTIESAKAAATESYQGQAFYFCSAHCRKTFKANPARYAQKGSGASSAPGSAAGHGEHGHGGGRRQ